MHGPWHLAPCTVGSVRRIQRDGARVDGLEVIRHLLRRALGCMHPPDELVRDLIETRAREVRYDMTPSPYDHLMERFRQLRVDTRELLLGDRLVVMES